MRRLTGVLMVLGVLYAPTPATGDEPPAPTLTSDQRKDLTIALQAVEIWRLRLQQATVEVAAAQAAFEKLAASVTPAGYRLNERLELDRLPASKAEPTKP